jgi:hypothetical protein
MLAVADPGLCPGRRLPSASPDRNPLMAVQLFGTTIRETLDYFLGVKAGGPRKKPPKEGAPPPPAPADPGQDERLRIWSRLVVSVLVTIGGTVMLMSGTPQAQQAGAGFIGLVIGYWLK